MSHVTQIHSVFTMPLNAEQIEAFLVESDLKYRLEEDGRLLTGFITNCYENDEGVRGIVIIVSVDEGGEFLEFTAPRLYDASRCHADRGKLFQVLLDITRRSKLVRFDHDPEDGEICASVTFPVEDGVLTRRQFRRMLEAIPTMVDRWHPVIDLAIDQGVVDLDAAAGGKR